MFAKLKALASGGSAGAAAAGASGGGSGGGSSSAGAGRALPPRSRGASGAGDDSLADTLPAEYYDPAFDSSRAVLVRENARH